MTLSLWKVLVTVELNFHKLIDLFDFSLMFSGVKHKHYLLNAQEGNIVLGKCTVQY